MSDFTLPRPLALVGWGATAVMGRDRPGDVVELAGLAGILPSGRGGLAAPRDGSAGRAMIKTFNGRCEGRRQS